MTKGKLKVFYALLLLGVCVGLVIIGFWRKQRLEENHSIVVAKVYNCSSGGTGNAGHLFVDFGINIRGNVYRGSSSYLTSELSIPDCNKYFVGKTFPAICNLNNPSISSILISPNDFKRYGYTFPDSLYWVLKYLNED